MRYYYLGAVLLLWIAGSVELAAQNQASGNDVQPRRIKVSDTKPGNRITVQIDPVEQAKALAPPPPVAKSKTGTRETEPANRGPEPSRDSDAAYAWFWDIFPAGADAAGPGRLDEAVAALTLGPNGTTVRTPRLVTLEKMAVEHGRDILQATIGTDVSPALVLAVMAVESAGKINATSSAGARGLMQLMPATAKRFGVQDITDPSENIQGGIAYLDWLMTKFGKDPMLVLAGYNAGENAVIKHGGVPPYDETRDYVPKVLAAWTVARGLCMTPPQLAHDGCVFRVGG